MNLEIELNNQDLPDEARKLILEQLYYVDPSIQSGKFNGDILFVEVNPLPADDTIKQKIISVCIETARSFQRVELPIFFENEASLLCSTDPTTELLESKQIIETAPGAYVYSGQFRKLVHGLSDMILAFAHTLGAIEQDYPATVPFSSLLENGYLASFPQHAFFVSPAQTSLENLNHITQLTKMTDADWRAPLASPAQCLAPTVCYHCFESLRGATIGEAGLNFTAVNKCFRHEFKTYRGLERLQTFTMREIICFNTQEKVSATLQQIVNFTKSFITDFGLQARIIGATDPFFAVEASKKRSFQSFLGLKQELQVYLPYNSKWLAVGSFNMHRDSLVKSYNITAQTSLNSGCVGYGLERLALGILAQQGCDLSKWNPNLQKIIH